MAKVHSAARTVPTMPTVAKMAEKESIAAQMEQLIQNVR